MMRFKVEGRINDGKAEAPHIEVDVVDVLELQTEWLHEELLAIPVGGTLLIERLA